MKEINQSELPEGLNVVEEFKDDKTSAQMSLDLLEEGCRMVGTITEWEFDKNASNIAKRHGIPYERRTKDLSKIRLFFDSLLSEELDP